MIIKTLRFATLALLAGLGACSGSAAPPAPAGPQVAPGLVRVGATVVRFGGPSSRVQTSPGWIAPDRHHKKSLLYASSYDGGYINVYPEKGSNQQPIGKLTTDLVSPQGMVVDQHHQLWVANTNAFTVVAFKRGATTPFTTLSDPNYFPISVGINSHGTVYAANAESTTGPPGNVSVWTKGHTSQTGTLTYSAFNIVLGVGVDPSDNVYVSYIPKSGPPAMVEFPAGSTTGQPVAIQDANVGDMSFDKSANMLMETLSNTMGVWARPYTSGPTRTIPAFGNEPTLDARQHTVWIAYANFSHPMVEGYDYTTGTQTDVITNGWTVNSAIPYGVALDPSLAP
ncbi:MAG TPA: hypothetical protein VMT95_11770 [Candidatus Binatia bacterium]|nr:hypothetical protein [Candidatus Binatia bacterium]